MFRRRISNSEKFPLLDIGRFAKPRSFKNVRNLPVLYETNQKAWMVSDIFSEWRKKLDNKFYNSGWKVAMVIDN